MLACRWRERFRFEACHPAVPASPTRLFALGCAARYAVWRVGAGLFEAGGAEIVRLKPDLLSAGDSPMSLVTDRRNFFKQRRLQVWATGWPAEWKRPPANRPTNKFSSAASASAARARATSQNVSKLGKIYALCDVDSKTLRRHGESLQDRAQLLRLPRDARQDGRQDRRRDGQHARSQPRGDGRQGDEDGQARPLPEAADAFDLGSPPAGRDRPRERASPRRWATSSRRSLRCARRRTRFAQARLAR